jgi:putative membrane protein
MTAQLPGHDVAVVESDRPVASATEVPWRRLDAKMIWVDAIRVLLSLLPAGIAILVVGVGVSLGSLWPALVIAVVGLVGATHDVLRWIVTRYRVTDEYVERRTGLLVRKYRSIRRDRIRSVDAKAKLRHRVARLRKVTIGAGQQNVAFEAALSLDAVSRDTAEWLRSELLLRRHGAGQRDGAATEAAPDDAGDVYARLRWSWIGYNLFNVWAYVMAIGLLWGAFWLGQTFGLDLGGFVLGLADWDALGWGLTIAIAAVVVGVIGVIGLAANFVSENWNFVLARVPADGGTVLRTTQGLFRTREINRDDNRLRGVLISEPLLWRWMRMADTSVITTGLSVWSTASTVVPRGPRSVALQVAAAVLERGPAGSPFEMPLPRHPGAALRRRLLWATLVSVAIVGLVGWIGSLAGFAGSTWWITALVLWPTLLGLAAGSYLALGHAVAGEYVVMRSGVMAWATAALQRRAVSGVALRQSLLQRRLGLMTVAVSTAAGYGAYSAPDASESGAIEFADEASGGLLAPFRV